MVFDSNGNHVIQKSISHFDSEKCHFIYEDIVKNARDIGNDKHGCCVMQRCCDYAQQEQAQLIVASVVTNCMHFLNDNYGNYVIQYVLEMNGFQAEKLEIGGKVAEDINNLCFYKFSSNVIEKCIKVDLSNVTSALFDTLQEERTISEMLSHKFANYVVQTLLIHNSENQKSIDTANRIKGLAKSLKNDEIASKAIIKLSKTFDLGPVNNYGRRRHHDNNNSNY